MTCMILRYGLCTMRLGYLDSPTPILVDVVADRRMIALFTS